MARQLWNTGAAANAGVKIDNTYGEPQVESPFGWGHGVPVPEGKLTLCDVLIGALPDGAELAKTIVCFEDGDHRSVFNDLRELARTSRIRVWGHQRVNYNVLKQKKHRWS